MEKLTLKVEDWIKHFQIENFVIGEEIGLNPSRKPNPIAEVTFSKFQIGRFSPMSFEDIEAKFELFKNGPKMKTIELPHGITLSVDEVNRQRTSITCSEMKSCPHCGDLTCETTECEMFDAEGHHNRIETNYRIEGVMLLIQSLYSHGFDHLIEEMEPAIESAMMFT